MGVAKRHWAFALSAAVLLHLGVAAAILWQAPTSGARESGIGGIAVSLGQAGGAPGSPTQVEADLPEAETAASPEEAATVPADLVAEVPPEAAPEPVIEAVDAPHEETVTQTEPVPAAQAAESVDAPAEVAAVPVDAAETPSPLETLEAAAVPMAVEAAAPLEVESVEPQQEARAAAVAVPPKPQRKPAPPQRAIREPVKPVQAAQSPAPVVSQVARKTETAALPKAETAAETATVAPAGTGGRSGTQASPDAGDATATSAGGQPAATPDYMAELLAWLERHKQYPRRARLRGQEGTAFLYFVMDRDGQVLDFSIKQTSGHKLLDREAKEMIERAQPLPEFPVDMAGARLALVVPVDFSLR
ncbi:MAG TPA: TonB family protein [Kiloniellaceae bacterium]|nr:TonB family protein [Kiloniellaceae bacterium]HIP77143.1 TonB family protein [Kiloniellaceae bacterium]